MLPIHRSCEIGKMSKQNESKLLASTDRVTVSSEDRAYDAD